MMMTFIDYSLLVIGGILAYIVGSIPSSVWVGRRFYGIDVREKGSKNAGATNTIRVLGLLPGIFVLFVDTLKGWFAVYLANFFGRFYTDIWGMITGAEYLTYFKLVLGVLAVIGHALPVFAGFKGGKGVATMLGVIIGIFNPLLPLILGIFLFTFMTSKYISLSSILAAISFPIFYITCGHWLNYETYPILIGFTIFVSLFILYTHRKNIIRLKKNEEPKFNFKKTIDE